MWRVFYITLKKIEKVLDFGSFVGDIRRGVGFGTFWPRLPGPGCQPPERIF